MLLWQLAVTVFSLWNIIKIYVIHSRGHATPCFKISKKIPLSISLIRGTPIGFKDKKKVDKAQ